MRSIYLNFRKVCLIIFTLLMISGFLLILIKLKLVYNKPRILCMVTTQPTNHKTKAKAVKETWGQRCDVLFFVSSQSDVSYPIIDIKCENESHNHLWCKNRKGLIYGFQHFYDSFDWFLKADDDTYIIMDNLRYFLSVYNSNDPLLFGLQFVLQNITYPSGGAGYVFSKEAISRLVNKLTDEKTDKKQCHTNEQMGADDLEFGRCLNGLNVKFGETRDGLGRGRFFPFQPHYFLNPDGNIYNQSGWLSSYMLFKYKQGFECCSDTTISFHYIYPPDMYALEFFFYHLKIQN